MDLCKMNGNEKNGSNGTLVLRVNQSGAIVALSEGALSLFGQESLGKSCDRVVRGTSVRGGSVCRSGCASALATGKERLRPPEDAMIRGGKVSLRCMRVGDEVVVVADQGESFDSTERLTPREREVLAMVGQGLSSSAIAERLGITAATVRTHVEHALGRLGAKTRAEAVLRALRTGQLTARR